MSPVNRNKQFWHKHFGVKDPKKVPTSIDWFGAPDGDYTDDDIDTLTARITHIDTLMLGGSSVTNSGVSYLIRMQYIGRLDLKGLAIDDRCILDLIRLRSLEQLHIGHADISADGVKQLQIFPHLQELTFSVPLITDDTQALYESIFPDCELIILR